MTTKMRGDVGSGQAMTCDMSKPNETSEPRRTSKHSGIIGKL